MLTFYEFVNIPTAKKQVVIKKDNMLDIYSEYMLSIPSYMQS